MCLQNEIRRFILKTNVTYAHFSGTGSIHHVDSETEADLIEAMGYLRKAGLLTEENRKMLLVHSQYADELRCGLFYLQRVDILTEKYCNALLSHLAYSMSLGYGLGLLNNVGLLTEENCTKLCLGKGTYVMKLLSYDQKSGVSGLTQKSFDELMESTDRMGRLALKNTESSNTQRRLRDTVGEIAQKMIRRQEPTRSNICSFL